MNVYHNLAGTTAANFKIGKGGVTILQGLNDPNSVSIQATNGDLYIRLGSLQKLYQFSQNVWLPLNVDQEFSRAVVDGPSFAADNSHHYLGVRYNGPVSITLPSGTANKRFIIKNELNTDNNIVIVPYLGDTIDGQTSLNMSIAYSSITIVYGAEWHII